MSILARALAGGLQGYGQGLTAEHERKEKSKGQELRRAYEMERERYSQDQANERARMQSETTLQGVESRAETARRGQDIGAETTQMLEEGRGERHAETISAGKASARRKEQLDEIELVSATVDPDTGETVMDRNLYRMLREGLDTTGSIPPPDQMNAYLSTVASMSTIIDPESGEAAVDEETGERLLDQRRYTNLRDGMRDAMVDAQEKFGDYPPPEQLAAYLVSGDSKDNRVWPAEQSYDWDEIAGLAGEGRSFASPRESQQAMMAIRDRLGAIGAQVPSGRPPSEGRMYEAPPSADVDPIAPEAPSATRSSSRETLGGRASKPSGGYISDQIKKAKGTTRGRLDVGRSR